MQKLIIVGGKKLNGSINISGSKNATLPILAASILSQNKVTITKLGRKILNKKFTIDEAFVETLLKYQLPTSKEDSYYKKGYNLKPLVATLHLIKKVNELCKKNSMNAPL